MLELWQKYPAAKLGMCELHFIAQQHPECPWG